MHRLVFICFIFLVACASRPELPRDKATKVIAEAVANDCDLALRQAKTDAADNVAGTFVHGRRTLLEDRYYSENLNEYSSGVVRRYNVLEKAGDNPCRIKIEAWVEPGSSKVDLTELPDSLGVSGINQSAKQISNNELFLANQFGNTNGFRVEFSNHEYLQSYPGNIRVALDVHSIKPPRGWLKDLESFISIYSVPVVYEPISIGVTLSRILTIVREGEQGKPAPWEFEICFLDEVANQVRCYCGEQNHKIIQALQSGVLELVLNSVDGARLNSKWPYRASYFTLVDFKTKYRALGREPRSDFPVVGLSRSTSRFVIDHPGSQLPSGSTITGHFRFADASKFEFKYR